MVVNPRDREDTFRLFVSTVEDCAIFLLDPRGHITSWNLGAQRLKGYTADEVIGQPLSLLYPPEAADRAAQLLAIAAREGHVSEEGWRVRKDGTRFWAHVVITALRDHTGSLIGFGKVTRDLTERKLAEEALRQSESRFRLLVENVRDYAIFMLDEHGHVLSWNAGAQRFKGYTADEIIGQPFSIFYPAEARAAGKPEKLLAAATAHGRVQDEDWRVRKDGSRFWADVVLTALRNESGELVGFAKITRDLTERREAEARLVASQVARARAETEAANALAQVRARDEFISVASHELRTPLAAARLHVESLQRVLHRKAAAALAETRAAGKITHILEQIDRLDELMGNLLDASRLTLGKLAIERQQVDLAELVRQETTHFAEAARAAGCALTVDVDAQIVGHWDRMRLQQVLANLLSNAAKYGAGKPIAVEAHATADKAVLRVIDVGIGIAPRDQKRIFDRFERAVSERNFAGLGLGLWITRQIVEMMGGTIAVESQLGGGARFTVELPR